METQKIKTNLDIFFFPQNYFRHYHVCLVQPSLFMDKENKR
jgi:hypothetical protein